MQTEPTPKTHEGILATVINCKDADIAPGTQVRVTGYVGTVARVMRQQSIGAPQPTFNAVMSFGWGDLEFDNKGAAVVLQAVSDRINDELDRVKFPRNRDDGNMDAPQVMSLTDRVALLAQRWQTNEAHLAGLQEGEELTDRPEPAPKDNVDKLPAETELLPEVWATLLGYEVIDWDGWNDVKAPGGTVGRYLGNPCTRHEFRQRIFVCTVANLAGEKDVAKVAPKTAGPDGDVMPCCGYRVAPGKPTTIFWSPFSEAVQCHNCGQTFIGEKTPAGPDKLDNPPHGAPGTATVAPAAKNRAKLPDTRPSVTHKFDVGGQKGYITVGCYDKACERPGEVFITVQKEGSTLQGFASAWARSVSMLLQYGVPMADVARMFAWHKFDPRGHTPDPHVAYAHSIVDYVARWLGYMFVEGYAPTEPKPLAVEAGQ